MRKRIRGAAARAAVLVIFVLAVAGAAYWLYKSRAIAGSSAFDLAHHLPKSAQAVWMVNLQGQIDPGGLKSDYEDVIAKLPAEQKKQLEQDALSSLGISLGELVGFFDGRAAGALWAHGQSPGAGGLIGLRDASGFEDFMKSKFPKDVQTEVVAGVTFTSTKDGWFGQDGTWAYFAESKASAEALVAAAGGQETLAGDTRFLEASGRVAESGSLVCFYWDIASTLKTLATSGLPHTDAQTFLDLACLQYAVGSFDLRSGQSNAFLKILDDKSPLSTKLLTKGSVSAASFAALGNSTSWGSAVDLEWTYNTVVQLGMVSPDTRQAAGMAGVGLAIYGNPFTAFEGEIALSSDWVQSVAPVLTENFGQATKQGQLTACKSNLKNMATALEMYSTDNVGHYPSSMGQLTPDYLRSIPVCPAAGSDTYSSTYRVAADPDSYKFACAGNHHQLSSENEPSYSSDVGLDGGMSVADNNAPLKETSAVVTARVTDPKLAHRLLGKLLGEAAGAEPKLPEQKVYPIPNATLVMDTQPPARLTLGFGKESAKLLQTKDGHLAEQARLKAVLDWGGDGAVYADYLDFQPLVEALAAAFKGQDSPELELMNAVLDKVKTSDLQAASCLTVRTDGIAYRADGPTGAGVLFVGGVGAALAVPNFVQARSTGQTTACKSNLKNIGTALEMYSTDYSGKYPTELDTLTPNYLRTIPSCPAADSVTYRAKFGPKAPANPDGYQDYYYLECAGTYHEADGLPENFPVYTSVQGLVSSVEEFVR